jgi:hypothetical protein
LTRNRKSQITGHGKIATFSVLTVLLVFSSQSLLGIADQSTTPFNVIPASYGASINANATSPDYASLSVVTLSDSVTSGTFSRVVFLIKNIGNTTIYSPTYTISVTQPLVVAENSTFSAIGTMIATSDSQVYDANLTSSPSATSGIYPAALQINYEDQNGSTHYQTYSVAIALSGSIDLVIQNELVSQNTANLTISGTLLNEGTTPAYYASISGSLNRSNDIGPSTYIGEVDPNSPLPFTTLIPYTAGNSSSVDNITLTISFKDNFGHNVTTQTKMSASLLSSGDLGQSQVTHTSQHHLKTILIIVGVSIVVIVAVVGAIIFIFWKRKSRDKSEDPKVE